jgi:hypothetical protein
MQDMIQLVWAGRGQTSNSDNDNDNLLHDSMTHYAHTL